MTQKSCCLCKNRRTLVNSHIVPEFMYEPVYLEGKAKTIAGNDLESRPKVFDITKGVQEHLLCSDCDNQIIGRIEDNAKATLDQIKSLQFSNDFYFLQVDYSTFKLFELSLLWRASISSTPMFARIKIGLRHEEKIRNMLMNNDPGEYYEYGCAIQVTTNQTLKRAMYPGSPTRFEGHHRYTLMTPGGIYFEYFVSSHTKSIKVKPLFLQVNGSLPICKTNNEFDSVHLADLTTLVQLSGK